MATSHNSTDQSRLAVITADPAASIALHEKFGFYTVGRHQALGLGLGLGLKFDRWLDVVHMQKAL